MGVDRERGARDFALGARMLAHLRLAVDAADHMTDGQRVLGEAVCGMLDTVCAGAPAHSVFEELRSDAEWWADVAAPLEVELYAGAALRRIERTPFAPRAKRRLMAALWQSLTVAERQAFLSRVMKDAA